MTHAETENRKNNVAPRRSFFSSPSLGSKGARAIRSEMAPEVQCLKTCWAPYRLGFYLYIARWGYAIILGVSRTGRWCPPAVKRKLVLYIFFFFSTAAAAEILRGPVIGNDRQVKFDRSLDLINS